MCEFPETAENCIFVEHLNRHLGGVTLPLRRHTDINFRNNLRQCHECYFKIKHLKSKDKNIKIKNQTRVFDEKEHSIQRDHLQLCITRQNLVMQKSDSRE